MKRSLHPLLLAAMLAGCAGTPSQEAAIEERGVLVAKNVAVDAPMDAPKRADEIPVETRPSGTSPEAGVQHLPDASVQTTAAAASPISEKPMTGVETQGLQAAANAAGSSPAAAQDAHGAAATADAQGAGAEDGGLLPQSDGTPTWGDLSAADSPLAQRRLLFDYDSAAIRDEYRAVLEAHAQFIKGNPAARAILQGHADERGSREYNLALGQRRAESVLKALNLLGVSEMQMEAVSFGEEKPIAEGHDESAWQQNRRTEVVYEGE